MTGIQTSTEDHGWVESHLPLPLDQGNILDVTFGNRKLKSHLQPERKPFKTKHYFFLPVYDPNATKDPVDEEIQSPSLKTALIFNIIHLVIVTLNSTKKCSLIVRQQT